MLAKVTSCAVVGLEGALVDVEVDLSNGQLGFTKVVPQTQSKCPA
jgi:magnesium chelatase family protein